jgi:membrane-associated phospholipid phosphatase
VSGEATQAREEPARGYMPVDLLMLAFLGITALLIVISPLTFPHKALYAVAHFAALIAVILVRFVPTRRGSMLRLARYGYPLLALPFLYTAVRYLNRLVTAEYFDVPIVHLEQAIFGCQPSQAFHQALPWLPLSEFLHLSYLAYHLLIPGIVLALVLQRRERDLALFATSIMTTFIACYFVFILFPVRGPYYYFGPIDPARQGVFFPQIANWMLESASSVGSAFPSSHVAAATGVWLLGRRFYPRWGWVLAAAAGAIFVATIYGGFHFAIDAFAGLLVGVAGSLSGPRFHAWWLARQRAGGQVAVAVDEERAAAS